MGRFISEDPLWGDIRDPQSLNRFAYGRNNPFRFVDPTGMEAFGEIGMAVLTDSEGNNGQVGAYDGGLNEEYGESTDSTLSGPHSIFDLGDPSITLDPWAWMPVHPYSKDHTQRNRYNSCPGNTPTRENMNSSVYSDRFKNDWEKDSLISTFIFHGGRTGHITFRNKTTHSQCTYDKNGNLIDNENLVMGTYDIENSGFGMHTIYDVLPHIINPNYEHGLTTVY